MEREPARTGKKRRKTSAETPAARPYQRPRGGEARGIAELMPEIGRTAFRRFGFVQSSIVSRWPEIAGERYAQLSQPESIAFPRGKKAEGTLNLIVSGASAVLMSHVEPELIERVNRFFGYRAVARIKYRQGRLPPVEPAPPVAAPRPLRPIPAELGDSLRDIGDPELLAVLKSLARSVSDGDAETADAAAKGSPEGDWPVKGNVRPIRLDRLGNQDTGPDRKDR